MNDMARINERGALFVKTRPTNDLNRLIAWDGQQQQQFRDPELEKIKQFQQQEGQQPQI